MSTCELITVRVQMTFLLADDAAKLSILAMNRNGERENSTTICRMFYVATINFFFFLNIRENF